MSLKMKTGKNLEVAPFINTTIIEDEIGTRAQPYLTNITTGKFTGASLIFHTEESGLHFEYTTKKVNSSSFYWKIETCVSVCYEIGTVGKYDFNGFESGDEGDVNYDSD